ncbi:MAG: hypothetical protein QOI98_1417 [Solirubrobacteraceae bacterium]|nr:hypothetical protein [Solirubrobacteraceae bacterium]
MASVVRLLTFVDIDDYDDPAARRMSVSARLEAVLEDGRRVVLLDDRGWSGHLSVAPEDEPSPGVWAFETVEEMKRTARVVVGPDEPGPGWTQAQMAAAHWDSLARVLREEGIEIDGTELRRLPHDVQLSDRVLARIGGGRPTASGDQ